ncbi:MFS transporter [Arthrobacter sp. KK5.5]|uniref:MFS transporter n=1 Tax=Arthrobacter sp. KK5.5 TaxID=3373084 RepID=UPI003EE46814
MTVHTKRPSAFRALLDIAGPAFFPIAFFARLPLAMLTIGALTLVSSVSGSYASGGLAAGAVGIGSAAGAPLLGYAADRLGQRRILLPSSLAHAVVVAALVLTVTAGNTGAGNLALALAAGATCPQVGSMARVRWMSLTTGRPAARRELETALSYESTVDELTFVMGPAIVGLLASLVAPWLPLALAAALTLLLVPAFAIHRTGTAVPQHGRAGHESAGRWDRGRLLRVAVAVAGMVGMGTLFGSTAAGAVAFAGHQGQPSAGGLLYAALGLTSAATALSVSAWPSGWAQPARWVACSATLVPLTLLLQLPASTGAMVLVLLLVGLPVGPVMVTVFTVGGDVAPAGRLGTVMTLLASGIVVGTAIGNSLAGLLADGHGHRGAFAVAAAAAVVLLAAGTLMARLRSRK